MLEVKTIACLNSEKSLPMDLLFSHQQKKRLLRAFTVLTENLPKPVVMEAIVVDHSGEVLSLPDLLVF